MSRLCLAFWPRYKKYTICLVYGTTNGNINAFRVVSDLIFSDTNSTDWINDGWISFYSLYFMKDNNRRIVSWRNEREKEKNIEWKDAIPLISLSTCWLFSLMYLFATICLDHPNSYVGMTVFVSIWSYIKT